MFPFRVSLEGVKEDEGGFSLNTSELKAWEDATICTFLYQRCY